MNEQRTHRATSADGSSDPVGLFGLARNTIRVAGETAASMASTSAVKSRSGAFTTRAPVSAPEISYMEKPYWLMSISVPGPA